MIKTLNNSTFPLLKSVATNYRDAGLTLINFSLFSHQCQAFNVWKLRKLSGAHLSALRTPSPEDRAARTPLSTVHTSPPCLSSIFHSVWSYPSERGCPLWKRKSEAWPSRTSPSSNPQSRPLSAGGLVVDATESLCVFSHTHTVWIYTGAGAGLVPVCTDKWRGRTSRVQPTLLLPPMTEGCLCNWKGLKCCQKSCCHMSITDDLF